MKMRAIKRFTFIGLAVFVAVLFGVISDAQSRVEYKITGKNASLQREVTGDVEVDVDGVPAQPVDSFVYDGYGSMPIKDAKITIKVDPVNNTGKIEAKWHDENGKWKYKQTVFAPPHHSTGLRVGPDASLPPELEMNDAIATNVYLHGNTTAGGPVLPTVFNLFSKT
jgi:hypothetical protein